MDHQGNDKLVKRFAIRTLRLFDMENKNGSGVQRRQCHLQW